jgi:hypothetical protein
MMKRIVRYMLVATVIAVGYAAWVMIGRFVENRRLEEGDQQRRAVAMQALPPALSGSELKILEFYAVPAELRPGEKARLCYGVLNATSVRMEPDIEKLYPALSRCFDIAPRTTTRYTLTAEGRDGRLVSESFVLRLGR